MPLLNVNSTNPLNHATGVALTSPVTVNFNENITMGSAFNGIYMENVNTGTMVGLKSINITGSTLTILMNSSRLFNNSYLVVIPVDAVTDSFGNNLTTAYNFTFTTVPLLKVVTSNPSVNATGVSLTSPVTVKFNNNITMGGAFNGIYIKNMNTGTVVGLKSKNITGNTLTITMNSNRLNNDNYKVYLPVGAVKDLLGHNLTSAYNFTFTTVPLLKVSGTNPVNKATGVSLTSPVTVKFNENIVAGVNFSKIYVKNMSTGNVIAAPSKMIKGNTLTLTFIQNRLSNNVYEIVIPAGAVHDSLGYNLGVAYTFTFKTL